MTLHAIKGFKDTAEAQSFQGLITQRVDGGAALAFAAAPKPAYKSQFTPS